MIIDGKQIAADMRVAQKKKLRELYQKYQSRAKLAIILVGNNPASELYVSNKIKAAKKIDLDAEIIRFDDSLSQADLLNVIHQLNQDSTTHAIIVQMPLPSQIDPKLVILAIDPNKDVDGFHPINVGKLYTGDRESFTSCTALGCLHLIKETAGDLTGKNILIIGRSNIVGRPLASLLLLENCTVTVANSKTKNLTEHTQKADIIVSAVGSPKFLTADYFNENSIIIDVGINRFKAYNTTKLVGDVDFEHVAKNVKAITPVPGGVGPMTVAYLLNNCIKAFLRSQT